jgi:hypothetical protein
MASELVILKFNPPKKGLFIEVTSLKQPQPNSMTQYDRGGSVNWALQT